MKKFLLFALPLFIFSCKSGVEVHKEAITKLGTDWDAATTSLTDFSGNLTKDVMAFSTEGAAMTMDAGMLAALKGPAADKYKMALDAYKKATIDSYTPVQNELSAFTTMWTEKDGAVKALKEGLAAGKIEGDIPGQLSSLTSLVSQGSTKIAAWTTKAAEVKTAADAALATLKTAYEAVAPKK
jgi:hypothetical protein